MKAGWNSIYFHELKVLKLLKTAFVSNVLAFTNILMDKTLEM